jgi:hypothetical protein
MAKKAKEIVEEPLEKKLWKAADKLRKNMDAAKSYLEWNAHEFEYANFKTGYKQLISYRAIYNY